MRYFWGLTNVNKIPSNSGKDLSMVQVKNKFIRVRKIKFCEAPKRGINESIIRGDSI